MKKFSLILLIAVLGVVGCKDKGKEVEVEKLPKTFKEIIIETGYWEYESYLLETKTDTLEFVDTNEFKIKYFRFDDLDIVADSYSVFLSDGIDFGIIEWELSETQDSLFIILIPQMDIYTAQRVISFSEARFETSETVNDTIHKRIYQKITDPEIITFLGPQG